MRERRESEGERRGERVKERAGEGVRVKENERKTGGEKRQVGKKER